MRWVGALGAAVTLLVALAAPAAAAPAPLLTAVPAAGCAGQQVPPPPPAVEEAGVPAPDPLPWPAAPVGGPEMGACGNVGPAGVPAVEATSWVLADLDTGEVLAAKAPHERERPASTLKVLLALVVRQRLDPDAVVQGAASDQEVDGSKAGIGPGGSYTVRQLLNGLLLNSGNDTAEALARTLGGDAKTTAAMADVAHQLGALDTRPVTPSGLDGPGMASSAYDLALLFRVGMRDQLFATTVGTHSVPFPGYGTLPGFELSNTNKLLANYPPALGAKAGFTDAARHTLVGAGQQGGRRLVVALTRGEQSPTPMWRQAAALMDWGFAQPRDAKGVGLLVDAAPVAPPAPVATAAGAPAPLASPEGRAEESLLPAGLIAAAAAAALAFLVFRRRSRR